MHNPLKNPERYIKYGEICHAAGNELSKPEVSQHVLHPKVIRAVWKGDGFLRMDHQQMHAKELLPGLV